VSDWYSRQFGDRDQFAISFALGRDPHAGNGESPSWGGFELWVEGRCLTRSISSEGGVADAVRWYMEPLLLWLAAVGARLVNEEPFPLATVGDQVRDACDWFLASDTAPSRFIEQEEDAWFDTRSEWRRNHALRHADPSVAVPNVVIRRLGHDLEVSWDNERWGSPRPGLQFVESRGAAVVPAQEAAQALFDAVGDLGAQLHVDGLDTRTMQAKGSAWRWLVHSATADLIRTDWPELDKRLSQQARTRATGFFVPHSPETLVLRQTCPTRLADVKTLLGVAESVGDQPLSDRFMAAVDPSTPSTVEPWLEGYERAAELRARMGWGDERLPDLSAWLKRHNAHVERRRLPKAIDLASLRREDRRGGIVLNSAAKAGLRREMGLGTALGHMLMDRDAITIGGRWEHWPSAARARAFSVMLALPDEGVRDVLRGCREVDAEAVGSVMQRFNTGPYATTYHLRNRHFISDEERITLLSQLVAA